MSAFASIALGDKIEIITDGASYDVDGRLLFASYKVHVSADRPIVWFGRGRAAPVASIAADLDAFTRGRSFRDTAMALAEIVQDLKGKWTDDSGASAFELAMAGFWEDGRPEQLYFHTMPPSFGNSDAPFTLIGGRPMLLCPADVLTTEELTAGGVTEDRIRTGMAAWGADYMELMRNKGGLSQRDGRVGHYIGCHVDLTIVTATSVTATRLRTWPDVVGEVINPFEAAREAIAA